MSQISTKALKEEVKQQRKMGVRLVLFPLPLQSHVTPMYHLANLLYSKGFSITIIQTNYKSIDPTHFPHFIFCFLDDGLPDNIEFAPNNLTTVLDVLNEKCFESFRNCMSNILSKADAMHQEPIACLITDPAWSFTRSVASSLSLPRIVLRCASLFTLYVYHLLPSLQAKGYYPLQETKYEEPVPELPPLKVKDLPPEAGHKLLIGLLKEMENSQGIICNTFEDLEGSYIAKVHQALPIPVFPLGPLHKISPSSQASIRTQDHTSISWLNAQAPKSVLYVSFGSIVEVSKDEFREIADGLANSNQPFLWVVRRGLVEGLDDNDPLPFPESYKDMVGQRGYIVNWAPQQQVLAHPSVGGFWTHCGWNSLIECVSEGVPMLCLPFFADQNINTRHVSDDWKLGLPLHKGINKVEIEMTIRKLTTEAEGEAMRNRIMTLKEKATLSLLEGGSTHKSLEKLTNYLLSF